MDKKILLLNSTCEILCFISTKKALKLIIKNKVDVISFWPNIIINYSSGSIHLPSTLKLKYFVHKKYSELAFSKKAVFKRDKQHCQYCGKLLKSGTATIDHNIPKSLGGQSTFKNCVAACYSCNNKKGNKTLEQVDMKLINDPIIPIACMNYISDDDIWNREWDIFFDNKSKNVVKQ